jgi:hypothetical protein
MITRKIRIPISLLQGIKDPWYLNVDIYYKTEQCSPGFRCKPALLKGEIPATRSAASSVVIPPPLSKTVGWKVAHYENCGWSLTEQLEPDGGCTHGEGN